jgi:hypothetical protein
MIMMIVCPKESSDADGRRLASGLPMVVRRIRDNLSSPLVRHMEGVCVRVAIGSMNAIKVGAIVDAVSKIFGTATQR